MSQLIKKIRTESGDLQIDYGALANLPALNNNLLINSDFRNPVNQREQTTYSGGSANTTTNLTYTIDRWVKRHYGSTVTVNNGYVRFQVTDSKPTDSGSNTYVFAQAIERPECLFGTTCTLSVKVKAVSGEYRMGIWQGLKAGFVSQVAASGTPYTTISTAGTYSITFTVNGAFATDCNALNVGLTQFSTMFTEGSYIDVEWMKLEQGTVATPFVPRPYAEELMICQRYFRRVRRFPIYAASSSNVTYMCPLHFSPGMRTNNSTDLIEVLNAGGTVQSGVTLVSALVGLYNVQNIQLSQSVGQFGFATITFDAEIY